MQKTITLTDDLIKTLLLLAQQRTQGDEYDENGDYDMGNISEMDVYNEGEKTGKADVARQILTAAEIPFEIEPKLIIYAQG